MYPNAPKCTHIWRPLLKCIDAKNSEEIVAYVTDYQSTIGFVGDGGFEPSTPCL